MVSEQLFRLCFSDCDRTRNIHVALGRYHFHSFIHVAGFLLHVDKTLRFANVSPFLIASLRVLPADL